MRQLSGKKTIGEARVIRRECEAAEDAQSADYFRTDHLHEDLKGRSVRGGVVTLSAQGCKFILQLGSTVVLARLLTPADFGLVAMVASITGFAAIFSDMGLSMATIQRQRVTHEQVSTLFWINLGLGALLGSILCAAAPAIAWFYAEPRLTRLTVALAAVFVLGGLAVQHTALLSRQMRFTALATVDVLSLLAGITVALVMAWRNFHYWALVMMPLTSAVTTAILVWGLCSWRPSLPRRGSGVRQMLKFGRNLSGFSLLNYFSRNADNVLIGWKWGPHALGIYSKAYGLLMLPIGQISVPVQRVSVPALSRLVDSPEQYGKYYLRAVSGILWCTAPLVALLFVCADDVVAIALGPQWRAATNVFRLLALSALFQPLYNATTWIFISADRTDRSFRWACVSSPLFISSFLVGLPWGPSGVALSYSTTFLLMLPWTLWYAFRLTSITPADLIRSIAPPLLTSIWLAAVAYAALSQLGSLTIVSRFASTASIALFVTAASCWAVKPLRREMIGLVSTARLIISNPASSPA